MGKEVTESKKDQLEETQPLIDLKNPKYYLNRELSLLEFNWRVLQEAIDENNPLLEQIKFTAIFSNNMDEFYMTRVAGLWSQVDAGVVDLPPDAMTPTEQLDAIRDRTEELMKIQRDNFNNTLVPRLEQHGIRLLNMDQLKPKQRKAVDKYFEESIFAVLTPLGVDPGRPFPFISNLSLSLAVVLEDDKQRRHFARVKIPTGVLPRLVALRTIMDHSDREFTGMENAFIFMEDIIAGNLDKLFPGMTIVESHLFRVTRDADIDIAEEEASDLLETIESGLRQRPFGQVTRLTMVDTMPERLRVQLMEHLKITKSRLFVVPSPLGLRDLFSLYGNADAPALKDPSFVPYRPTILTKGNDIFARIREHDILLHHPYDSFSPIVEFVETAAVDPQVLAIKCTLYRLGPNSPIISALMEARANDKQVAALVELKARFDEENNITWAKAMEAEGVHVIYGFPGLKTHCKIVMVVRQENDGLRRYIHLGTGNYNPTTARMYSDLGLFTCREDIGHDASLLFNRLTGFAPSADYRTLTIAPQNLRDKIISLIDREIEQAKKGKAARLIFKMNSLVDPKMIRKLYEASIAGVKIDLLVRGICCLRPGLPDVSANITLTSIVGRFLEHARIYYFHNGGESEIYLSSADMMPRNLDRRVEIMFPIEDDIIKTEILEGILEMQLKDTDKARMLHSDGTYHQKPLPDGESPFNIQKWFIDRRQGS